MRSDDTRKWVGEKLYLSEAAVKSMLVISAGFIALVIVGLWFFIWLFRRSQFYPKIRNSFIALIDKHPGLYISFSLSISILTLAVFGELAWMTLTRNAMDMFDNFIIQLVRYYANPELDKVMLVITKLGSASFYSVFATFILLILVIRKRKIEASWLLVCLLGGNILNEALKHIFMRARPELFRVITETGYSFPSGHAMVALCFYGMLAFLIARKRPLWQERFVIFLIAGIFIAAIGTSRIYLGVHYPTDVLAGFTAGTTWLTFCIASLMWWENKRIKRLIKEH